MRALFFIGAAAGAIVVLTTWLDPKEPVFTSDARHQQETRGYRPGGSGCEPAKLDRIRSRSKRASEADRCKEAEEDYRVRVHDLEQQRRSASATEAAARLAYDQTRAGVLAATFDVFTFVVTLVGLLYALDQLRTANLGARAWLDVDLSPARALLFDGEVSIDAVVMLRNGGSAPSKDVCLGFTVVPTRLADDLLSEAVPENEPAKGSLVARALPPGGDHRVRRTVTLAWGEGLEVDPAIGVLPIIGVRITYTLLNGEQGVTVKWFKVGTRLLSSEPGQVELAPFRLGVGSREQSRLAARAIGYGRME